MFPRAHLIAVAYDSTQLADGALGAVHELSDEHALIIHDAAIVIKKDDGRIELRPEEGGVSGRAIGLLLGLALAVPVAGVNIAAELGATIARGRAVLFVLVGEVDWRRLREVLAPYGGDLVSSEVAGDVLPLLG